MMGTHRKIVGAVHLVMGVLALVPVMVVTAVFGGVMGVVAVATRNVHHAAQVDAILGISLAAILMIVFCAVALAGVLGIIAGFGVLTGHRWADIVATVLSGLHVFNVPVGTALAAYTVWALWFAEPAPQRALPVRERSPDYA